MENELPRTTITVDTFYLEEHEVTNRQYKDFVDATGYQPVPRSDDPRFAEYDWDRETRTYPSGQGDYPVVNVTLPDARAYAKWAGRRLPTELEWEYAARQSRESALYPWGNSLANRLFGNFDGSRLLPVASYPPNELGLYDLAGNAFEWMGHGYVEDLHEQLEAGRDIQILLATTETRYALLRGGAFYSTAREIRNSYREYNDASVRYPGYSFRLAADAP
jgi:formylglycine-generating enzyme required for sulfatase activity